MDWGAALAGIDSELQQRIKNNAMQTGTSLDVLRTGADLRNAQADNLRADQAAGDLSRYRDNEIQVRNRAVARNEAVDAVKQADKDELDKLSAAWAAMPEGPEKVQAGALLSARIKGFKPTQAGGSVLTVQTGPDGKQTLANIGTKGPNDLVLKPGAGGAQGYVPDEKTLTDAADAMRAGDPTLWNALIARGAAGNVTREALAKAFSAGRPDDYAGFASTHATLKADSKVLGVLKQAASTQAGLHEAATKNFEVMKQTMSTIPDLNAPWLNVAPRYIDKKLLDPAAMSAFNMARVSALREYERLVSSNLDAKGQITDAARKAYDELLDEDTPMSAVISAMVVMNQDMTNLQGGIVHQKEAIDEEIKNLGKAKPAGTTTPTATGGAVANHPDSVGKPVEKQFEGFPPVRPVKPGSVASQHAIDVVASTFKKTAAEAKAYLAACGYAFKQ